MIHKQRTWMDLEHDHAFYMYDPIQNKMSSKRFSWPNNNFYIYIFKMWFDKSRTHGNQKLRKQNRHIKKTIKKVETTMWTRERYMYIRGWRDLKGGEGKGDNLKWTRSPLDRTPRHNIDYHSYWPDIQIQILFN